MDIITNKNRISFQIIAVNGEVTKEKIKNLSGDVTVTLKLIDSAEILPLFPTELFYNKRQGNVYRAVGDSFLMPLS